MPKTGHNLFPQLSQSNNKRLGSRGLLILDLVGTIYFDTFRMFITNPF